ncbi:MAG: hypothetical protein JWM68_4964 [Verrucomicrobiales bacterium]|nr:hypothetical protein [Verrucomicrobiales bacterium]
MNPDIPSCGKVFVYNTAPSPWMLKYSLICLGTLVVLTFLKFVEESPVRSWKMVFFTAIPLAAIICYYVSCAFPPPLPPAPEKKKIENYRAQMELYVRHIAGVRSASINGSRMDIDLDSEYPLQRMRQIALSSGSTAAQFMKPSGSNLTMTIHVTAIKRDRLEIEYDTKRGIVREQTFD